MNCVTAVDKIELVEAWVSDMIMISSANTAMIGRGCCSCGEDSEGWTSEMVAKPGVGAKEETAEESRQSKTT